MKIEAGKIEYAEEICSLVSNAIIELCALDHNNDKATLSDWLRNKTVRNFRSWIENNHSFCAVNRNREIVGFSLLSPTNEILLHYVSPGQHRMGVGRSLLKEIEISAKKPCILRVNSTQTALGFYLHMGFVASPRDPEMLVKKLGL